ncbi:MAG: galactan 5-O-arabinofuranosyltransferase [Gordonia sp. (in: high G+C Gram-positive bacteria)]
MTSTQSLVADDTLTPAPPPRHRYSRHAASVIEVFAAAIVGALIAYVGLTVIGAVQWPAYNSSNVTRALTTAGQVGAIALVVVAALAYRYGRSRHLVTLVSAVGISALVTVTLGMPLGATRLYLSGLSADQQFRTEYLTRLTNSPHLADMTYLHMPPYYPAGWFWAGGRYACVLGLPGWEAYKSWAIISIAAAAAVGVILWNRMVGADRGGAAALALTAVTVIYAGPEPYAAVLVVLGIPMLIPMLHALRGTRTDEPLLGSSTRWGSSTSWAAIGATGAFLGLSATFYTLYAGLFAGVAILMALTLAGQGWINSANTALPRGTVSAIRRRILVSVSARIIVMGAIAALIALSVWTPYLLARLRREPASGGTAEHYLPEGGSVLPLPMFHLSLIGAITMIGAIWIVLRFRRRTIAAALGIAVVGVYLMCLLSMLLTAVGTTLLAFRLEPIVVGAFAVAGVFGVAESARWAVGRFGDVRTAIGILATAAAIMVAQGIPGYLSGAIVTAYTDTDGYGQRADQRPPGAESYYPQLDRLIGEQTGRAATDNVVLTADYGFLSIYPYWGFQNLTSHYSNPLAEFDKRAEAITEWAASTTSAQLIERLDHAPWTAPNVFLFRYSADGYALRLAQDVYPNDPNVKRYTVLFDPTLFAGPQFRVTNVGPFVLVIRR